MLNNYVQRTQQLLSDLKQEAINPAILVQFVNTARGQIAGEAECIRVLGTVSTVIGQRNYLFSGIDLGVPATTGAQAPIHVRSMMYDVGVGQRWFRPRNWEWFQLYKMNNPAPDSGPPAVWSQYAQGANGSFYLDPIPDFAYVLTADCVCHPVDLADDTTVEAIPYLWTDSVPYYAAYLSYEYVQRKDRAKSMFDMFDMFMTRARKAANPSVNRYLYQQSQDPTTLNKLGITPKAAS